MPRLSSIQYTKRHLLLKHAWLHNRRIFARLSFSEQRALHDFYYPARDLTPAELRLAQLLAGRFELETGSKAYVLPLVRPEINGRKFAQVLLELGLREAAS
jgi:hypothetical protein